MAYFSCSAYVYSIWLHKFIVRFTRLKTGRFWSNNKLRVCFLTFLLLQCKINDQIPINVLLLLILSLTNYRYTGNVHVSVLITSTDLIEIYRVNAIVLVRFYHADIKYNVDDWNIRVKNINFRFLNTQGYLSSYSAFFTAEKRFTEFSKKRIIFL